MSKHYPKQDAQLKDRLRTVARQMRTEPTPAEDLLWQRLRGRQLCGYKSRRQHTLDRFIVDFCCPSVGLIVEVDGDVHRLQVEADQEREADLTNLGFRVIRFTNEQVSEQIDWVLQRILDALECTPSPFSSFGENGEGAGG